MAGRRETTLDAGGDGTAAPAARPAAPVAPGQRLARRTRVAVDEAERRICGSGAVTSSAVAQGLALAGKRAAVRLAPPAGTVGGGIAAPWVEHRILAEGPAPSVCAFELVAATPQEAVDHCLAAHELAARLRRPGCCFVDRSLAERPALVCLPQAEWIEALPPVPRGKGTAADGADIGDVARGALESVAARTGRPLPDATFHDVEGARYLIVADGSLGAAALELVRKLRGAGAPCGAVVVRLVHPLSEALCHTLRAAEGVVLLSAGEVGPFAWGERLVLRLGSEPARKLRVLPATVSPAELGRLWEVDLAAGAPPAAAPSSPRSAAVVGAVPAGAWMEELLLDSLGWAGLLGPLELDRSTRSGVSAIRFAAALAPEDEPAPLDLLVVAHVAALAGAAPLEAVREEGRVLVHSQSGTAEAVWCALSEAQREVILRRRLRLGCIDLPPARRTELEGAILSAVPPLAGFDGRAIEALESAVLHPEDRERLPDLRRGAGAVAAIDAAALEAASRRGEKRASGEPTGLPAMPAPAEVAAKDVLRERLHHFHLTGSGALSAVESLPALPLKPAALEALAADSSRGGARFPLVLVDGDEAERRTLPLRELIAEALAARGEAAVDEAVVANVERRAADTLRQRDRPVELRVLLDEVGQRPGQAAGAESGSEGLPELLSAVGRELPADARVLGAEPEALLPLYAWAVPGSRRRRRADYAAEVQRLVAVLEGLLQIDSGHSTQAGSAESVGSTLGRSGAEFLDAGALARHLPRREGSRRLPAGRLFRVRHALNVLREFRERLPRLPELIVVRPASAGFAELPGQRTVVHEDGLRAAIGLFDGLARDAVEVVRAVRTARLEAENGFDETFHGPVLERLQWQSLNADELLLLPPLVVLETARRLRGPALAAFSELLRSGRPVHVLVSDSASSPQAGETWEELSGYDPGLGYLAVAHREAFVVQSTLARAEHLVSGLGRMAGALGPAVALVLVPDIHSPVEPALQLQVALQARVMPCFSYDPAGGASWAERFSLAGNPDPDSPAPELRFACLDEGDERRERAEPATFAHVAALDPGYRPHFRVLGPDAWLEDQVELGPYLRLSDREKARHIPFLWVVDDAGRLLRAVMTREIVFACRDRTRAWRILQELGGTDNEYSRRAADEARSAALAQADRRIEELEAAHREALAGANAQGAAAAVQRLVGVLTGPEEAALASTASPAPIGVAAVEVPAPPEAPAPAEAEPAQPAEPSPEVSEQPYIDSFLCTTCNDCIDLNPRMFKYNANKQAEIADAGAGTFDELVRAAEGCPARCIHPGTPRPDDSSVTDDLKARAAKFA